MQREFHDVNAVTVMAALTVLPHPKVQLPAVGALRQAPAISTLKKDGEEDLRRVRSTASNSCEHVKVCYAHCFVSCCYSNYEAIFDEG